MTSNLPLVDKIVRDLLQRNVLTEADIQSSIKTVLLTGEIGLADDQVVLEDPMGDGSKRRIDIRFGQAIIETKKDLSNTDVRAAVAQLAGYVQTRTAAAGVPYIGILTDGRDWRLYDLIDDALVEVSRLVLLDPATATDRLVVWLESALATKPDIPPTPHEIEQRLGVESPAHHIDIARLTDLYREGEASSEVRLKRELWAKLLRTSFGAEFVDDEALFISHTLLVLSAEVIAHAAVGFDVVASDQVATEELVTGRRFRDAQIYGVVEEDFFDWVLDVDGGREFIAQLARRISRFVWADVENDVLKILYESVIPATERERLGEYYTPDWLADRVVHDTIEKPLSARVADPSCGSGTFLFHAVRQYLAAAEAAGTSDGSAAMAVCDHVVGMDIHPVAVTLARVTYLLAIGRDRLAHPDRGVLGIPVYLGDSMQWEQSRDLLDHDGLFRVSTHGEHLGSDLAGAFLADDLVFPRTALTNAQAFTILVSDMAEKALDIERYSSTDTKTERAKRGQFRRSNGILIEPILKKHGLDTDSVAAPVLRETFAALRRLVDTGRNHIWAYYVRNLVRPVWLSLPENRVTHLVGNPPWLRYSKMTTAMQGMYRRLSSERELTGKGTAVTGQDLATLFVVRATELYLEDEGRAAFVMPHGTMTRVPHVAFRTGVWSHTTASLTASFEPSWDLQSVDTGFPMASCVIRFQRTNARHRPLPDATLAWSGRLTRPDVPWGQARERITTSPDTISQRIGGKASCSPYKSAFRQGATLVPRMTCFVEESAAGPLGAGAGRIHVTSRRTGLEKTPWKDLPSISGNVPREFVWNVHLGETVLPFRPINPLRAVLPISDSEVLSDLQIASTGFESWWRAATELWDQHRKSTLTLSGRYDFSGELRHQLPLAPLRVVYSKAGSILTAALLDDPTAVIDHNLYWAPVGTRAEGHYLSAILNSAAVLERVKPLQTVGLFGPRHFDKHIFDVPIPAFDADNGLHLRLAELGKRSAELASVVDTGTSKFQAARKKIRTALEAEGVWKEINDAVLELIPAAVVDAIADDAKSVSEH